jgi:hypothetical protein
MMAGTFSLMWEVNHGGELPYVACSSVDFVCENIGKSAMNLACEINKEQKHVTMSMVMNYLFY